MQFISTHIEYASSPADGVFFLFTGSEIILTENDGPPRNVSAFANSLDHIIRIGDLDGRPCYTAEYSGDKPDAFDAVHLRMSHDRLGEELFALARYAFHLEYWDRISRFCGKCGTATDIHPGENAKLCPACKYVIFPRIAPAVIVAVTRGDKILLARARSFTRYVFSVLAGFVEPGETLEECVRREIKEEVGIDVTDIRYFGSQPWPFPNSLMVGFTAVHAGGEISLDDNEMIEADWFSRDNLPPIPEHVTIARQLIDRALGFDET